MLGLETIHVLLLHAHFIISMEIAIITTKFDNFFRHFGTYMVKLGILGLSILRLGILG